MSPWSFPPKRFEGNSNPLYAPSLYQRLLALLLRRKTFIPLLLLSFLLFPFTLFTLLPPNAIHHFSTRYLKTYFGEDAARTIEGLKYPTVRLVARTEERRMEDAGVGELGGWFGQRLFPRGSGVGGEGWAWSPTPPTSTKAEGPAQPLFSSVFPFLRTTPSHLIPATPLLPELPTEAPKPEEMLFNFVTTAERAKEMSSLWEFFLRPRFREVGTVEGEGDGRPKCLVVLPLGESEKNRTEVEDFLRVERDVRCKVMVEPAIKRYETRVLATIRHMRHYASNIVKENGADIKWYIMGDDDTFWTDIRTLRRMLSKYSSSEKRFIGGSTEATNQIELFGKMAYGGAGMILSKALMDTMYLKYDECLSKFGDAFGGDQMISSCAALAIGKSREDALTEELGMHQFDVKGGGQGIFQSGMPFLSMHHLAAWMWIGLMPWGHPIESALQQNILLGKAAWFLGGDNMFRRWVFDEGKTLVVMGYAIVFYEKPVPRRDWDNVEWTWEWAWRLVYPWRKGIPEYSAGRPDPKSETYDMEMAKFDDENQKVSYYLEHIDILDEREATFTYVNEKKDRINVVWDGNWELTEEATALRLVEGGADAGLKRERRWSPWRS
ncbi:glycosyltransferase family 31 protein [Atractiella rhizophila]|nr:glycosyltransferase family 31 protein [Atractiella rhizophila]